MIVACSICTLNEKKEKNIDLFYVCFVFDRHVHLFLFSVFIEKITIVGEIFLEYYRTLLYDGTLFDLLYGPVGKV